MRMQVASNCCSCCREASAVVLLLCRRRRTAAVPRHAPTQASPRPTRRLQALLLLGHQDQLLGALLSQAVGDALAHAAGCAGDANDLVLQQRHVGAPRIGGWEGVVAGKARMEWVPSWRRRTWRSGGRCAGRMEAEQTTPASERRHGAIIATPFTCIHVSRKLLPCCRSVT